MNININKAELDTEFHTSIQAGYIVLYIPEMNSGIDEIYMTAEQARSFAKTLNTIADELEHV